MRKWYFAGAVGVAAFFAASCTDVRESTGPSRPSVPSSASPTQITGAAFSTVNETEDGPGHCKNGNPNINCNIYDAKKFVWLNGGPSVAYVGPGNYFFAVLQPSGQGGNDNPNDGTPKNLSDQTAAPWTAGRVNSDGTIVPSGDSYLNRTFNVADDVDNTLTYTGTHLFKNNKIRLWPYDDTPNPGGVYILAICNLGAPVYAEDNVTITGYAGYPVSPSDCKYDAFKIVKADDDCTDGCGGGANTTLSIEKTLTTTFKRTYAWTVDKASTVDKIQLAPGQSTSVPYTVKVETTGSTDSDYGYSGTVVVTNTGLTPAKNVFVTDDDPTITLSCTPTATEATKLASLGVGEEIDCTYSKTVQTGDPVSNSATVTWRKADDSGDLQEQSDPANGVFDTPVLVDNCVPVTDNKVGALGTVCATNPPAGAFQAPKTFTYSNTVTAPTGTGNCGTTFNVDNTATVQTSSTTDTDPSDNVHIPGSVVCGCTLGYWKNNDLYEWKSVKGTYQYVAAAGGSNGGTADYFWKNTFALGVTYPWSGGAANSATGAQDNYRTKSSLLKDPQAFGPGATPAILVADYTSLASLGFYQALSLPGGTTFLGKAQNLMRQATAGLLNATWTAGGKTIGYPLSAADLVAQVNAALATKNQTTIDNLQKVLAGYNQGGTQDLNNNNACPINAQGVWWPH